VPLVYRVLPPAPLTALDDYRATGGGAGLEAALAAGADTVVAEVEASGLRGRGGAGFPTGRKWRAVTANRSPELPATVVVNGAEGEPGTFKDRTILRMHPHAVVEGALIAARAIGATHVVFALKQTFAPELRHLRAAVDDAHAAGWADAIALTVFEGPEEYLYGEETALLEAVDGRMPFPRIAPPFRRGVTEVVETDADLRSRSGLAAHVEMAAPDPSTIAPPTLVNNVETLANVPAIVARGAEWFRSEGTEQSPGTIVCTVTGSTVRAGVGEVAMGTPLRDVIELVGGGVRPGRRVKAVATGISNALVPEEQLDTPVSYEAMAAIGSGLGSAGFVVFDDEVDMAAVAAGASRFLAVESCGQCRPCKQDGLAIADLLAGICRSEGGERDLDLVRERLQFVTDGARCFLAYQQQNVVGSILDRFASEVEAHMSGKAAPVEPALITELLDVAGDVAVLNEDHLRKQPDWTYGEEYSGQSPADRDTEHRAAS